jgi:hypothetical protein
MPLLILVAAFLFHKDTQRKKATDYADYTDAVLPKISQMNFSQSEKFKS